MNYKKIYDSIIEKRKIEDPTGYTEVHHIVPKSLGGSDEQENLIRLSSREHFICHYLLVKMYPKESIEWYKMNNAFLMMKCTSLNRSRYFSSRLYEALRGNFSSIMSIVASGKGNSQYGTIWISNIELQENKKISKDDVIPDGWIAGRNKWNTQNKKCLICGIDTGSHLSKYCEKHRYPSTRNYKHSIESKKKMSVLAKDRIKLVCPHCGIEVDPGNYNRHHGDKCKFAGIVQQ